MARRAEQLGFESLWLGDHLAVPTSDTSSARDKFYEALSVLGFLAGVTTSVKLGTGVIIIPYRHPVYLAGSLATADCLSGGRLIFGASSGWMEEEFRALGVPFRNRGPRTDEYLRVVQYLWETPRPHSFSGRFVDFRDIKYEPAPVQRPKIPLWIGGNSRAAMERAVKMGDAWFPLHIGTDRLRRRVDSFDEACQSLGREQRPLLAMNTSVDFKIKDEGASSGLFGSVDRVMASLGEYSDAGLDYLVSDFPREGIPEFVESMETFAERVIPAFR